MSIMNAISNTMLYSEPTTGSTVHTLNSLSAGVKQPKEVTYTLPN